MKPIFLFAALASLLPSIQAQEVPLTLQKALAMGQANRPVVVSARQRLESARLQRGALGAYPSTSISLGYTAKPDVGASDNDLFLSQPLDIFGRALAGRSLGDALVRGAEADLRGATLDVQAEVLTAYFEAAGASELARVAGQQLEIANRLRDAARIRVEAGRAPGVQLDRAELEAGRLRRAFELRQAESEAGLKRLAGALGSPDTKLETPHFEELPTAQPVEEGLASRLPELLLLNALEREGRANARIARLSRLPEVELEARRSPWYQDRPEYGARLQLSFPLLDHGRSDREARAASARAESARSLHKDRLILATAELRAAKRELDAAEVNAREMLPLVDAARELARKSEVGFREGAMTLFEILESLRAQREVEEALVEARLLHARTYTAYLRAGGVILEVSP